MAELKYVKELLQTGLGTEGQLLVVRKIYDTLIDEVDKKLIPRSLASLYFGPAQIPGSSVDVDLVTPNKMDVRLVGEGAEIPMDETEYSSFNVKPDKYGVAIRITSEMLEDGKWNLLQHNIKVAGKRFAENENSLIITQSLDNATNTVSGGAAITIANITRAMQYLDDSDYEPTTFIIGMEVLNDLRNIDTFVEYNKSGSMDMLDKGFKGNIYGMEVVKVSTNAGMTTTTSFVLDKDWAYLIAEKRPISIEAVSLPSFDMSGAVLTQRIRTRYIRAASMCKITTS